MDSQPAMVLKRMTDRGNRFNLHLSSPHTHFTNRIWLGR